MARKIIIIKDKLFECPNCGYRWSKGYDLAFDTNERCPCCPNCNELIEDGDDDIIENKNDDVCKWKQTSTAKYKTECGYKLEEFFDTNACFCKQCGRKIKVIQNDN